MLQIIHSVEILWAWGCGIVPDLTVVQFDMVYSYNPKIGYMFLSNTNDLYGVRVTTGVYTNGKCWSTWVIISGPINLL